MPNFLAPRKSGAHRIAAIALYRALISQCRTVPIAEEHQIVLSNVIRNKFRRNIHLTSKTLLKDAFVAGYEGLDRIYASSTGHEPSTSYILSILNRLPPSLTKAHVYDAPREREQPRQNKMVSGFENTTLARRPLPLSSLSGNKRRVPVLVSANRIPILRTHKPQAPALSMYIKAKMVQRQRRHDRRWDLVEQLRLAKLEDSWEQEMEKILGPEQEQSAGPESTRQRDSETQESGRRGKKRREGLWSTEIYSALDEIGNSLEREAEKNRFWAAKMMEIVDKEKALAEQERKERVMAKNMARRESKRLRDTVQPEEEPQEPRA